MSLGCRAFELANAVIHAGDLRMRRTYLLQQVSVRSVQPHDNCRQDGHVVAQACDFAQNSLVLASEKIEVSINQVGHLILRNAIETSRLRAEA